MRVGIAGGIVLVLVLAAIVLGYSSLFTVYQTQQALVVRLGQPVRVVTEPGLNFKVPTQLGVLAFKIVLAFHPNSNWH